MKKTLCILLTALTVVFLLPITSRAKTESYTTVETVDEMQITINESFGTISAMNSDSSHNTYCYGTMTFEGVTYNIAIKGRGNATWTYGKKKPYNLTILADGTYTTKAAYEAADTKKAELFPGIKEKKWSLLANLADGSLLRNKIGYDLACALGIGIESRYVEVYFNGSFYGNFLLTPKSDYQAPSNGYFLELDNKTTTEATEPQFSVTQLKNSGTEFSNKFTIKDVGKNTAAELCSNDAIAAWMQEVMNAIEDTNSELYQYYIDVDSFAKMYLLHEFYKSYDSLSGSMFMYRDFDSVKVGKESEAKLVAGPIWDLDNTMGRSQLSSGNGIPKSYQNSPDKWHFDSIQDGYTSFFQMLGKHQSFMKRVYEIYNEYKEAFDSVEANIDKQVAIITDSAAKEYNKWGSNCGGYSSSFGVTRYTAATTVGTAPYKVTYKKTTTWSDYVYNLRLYVTTRLKFLSDQLAAKSPSGIITGITEGTAYASGTKITLTANVTDQPDNITYKWQISTDGKTFTDISGATSATYTFTATGNLDGSRYRCLIGGTILTVDTAKVADVTLSSDLILGPVTLSTVSQGLQFTSYGDGTCSLTGIGSCTDSVIIVPEKSPAGDTVVSVADGIGTTASYAYMPDSEKMRSAIVNTDTPYVVLSGTYKKIILPATVKIIGKNAFCGVSTLEEVALSEGICYIYPSAFSGCSSLRKINIPSTLEYLNYTVSSKAYGAGVVYSTYSAFANDSIPEIITVSANNNRYFSVQNTLYERYYTELLLEEVQAGQFEFSENKCTQQSLLFGSDIATAKITVTDGSSSTNDAFIGTGFVITASGDNFDCWVDSANSIVSTNRSFSFIVSDKESYRAVYKNTDTSLVTIIFVSDYDQILKSVTLRPDEITEDIFPAIYPVKYGYVATGWEYTLDELKTKANERLDEGASDKRIKVDCNYEIDYTTVTVTITGGTADKVSAANNLYSLETKLTVTADAPASGKKFSCWKDSKTGEILSYNEKYSFIVTGACSLTAVYVDSTTVQDAVGITKLIDVIKDKTNNRISFVSHSTIPEGCTIIKAGVIMTTKSAVGTNEANFNIDTATYVYGNSYNGTSYRFTFTYNNAGTKTCYARAFLTYSDADGFVHTVYSDVTTASLTN